jgi:hypothetical protein
MRFDAGFTFHATVLCNASKSLPGPKNFWLSGAVVKA